MSVLSQEVWQVQNPALGALLLWRFVVGYEHGRDDARWCPLPLLFIVLPTLFHQDTAKHVRSTRKGSGLRAFAAKFSASAATQADVLLGLNDRARAMRRQSLHALRMATGGRLVSIDANDASVFTLSTAAVRGGAEEVRLLAGDAERLGHWCAQVTLFEVASTLKVRF
jgi:hypothetical protein